MEFALTEYIEQHKAYRGVIFETDPDSGAASVKDILECSDEYYLASMMIGSMNQLLVKCPQHYPGAIPVGNSYATIPSADVGSRVKLPIKLFFQTLRRLRKFNEQPEGWL